MCRMLLILLYGAGCASRALHLTLRDIDLIEKIVTVRHTKFFKTRFVPIGPKLGRNWLPTSAPRDLLCRWATISSLYNEDGPVAAYPIEPRLFHHVRTRRISLRAECLPPRIHDIRHYYPSGFARKNGVCIWNRI